jgi:hypothetical protein
MSFFNNKYSYFTPICLFLLLQFFVIQSFAQNKNCQCDDLQQKDIRYSSNQKILAYENQQTVCAAQFFYNTAVQYLNDKKPDSALQWILKSNQIFKFNKCIIPISNYQATTNIYENLANFDLALQSNLELLEKHKTNLKPQDFAEAYLSIAQIFNRLKQSTKGINYTKLAIPLVEKLEVGEQKASLLNKITARYFFYYQDTKNDDNLSIAWQFVIKALQQSKLANSRVNIIIAYTRMNAIKEAKGRYDEALAYIDSAMQYCDKEKDIRQLSTLYGDKGHLLMNMGNLKLARQYADSCLYATQKVKYPPIIANAYSLVYEIALKDNNFKDALWALENEKKITDSLLNSKNVATINELEKKYNQSQNEHTIQNLSNQRKIYILAIVIIICVILFILWHQQQKHKQKVLETEQRLNRARINPHFFFNTLTALQSLAHKNGNTIEMSENLAKFSHIMREALESTYKEYNTIEQEIDFLNEYLQLQSIRFPNRFKHTLAVDDKIEIDELCLPSMIIEPFVENAIEHGLHDLKYEGKIEIKFELIHKELKITIQDNGNGINLTSKAKQNHTPRASQIIKDRIYLLNVKLKTNARFSIQNVQNDVGVLVEIYLPLIYKNSI